MSRQLDTPEKRRDYALNIGLKWIADSSLEKWFPFTAQELANLNAELTQLKAQRDALRESVALASHMIRLIGTTDCDRVDNIKRAEKWLKLAGPLLAATAQKQDKI